MATEKTISKQLLEDTLAFLNRQPFHEVEQGVKELETLHKASLMQGSVQINDEVVNGLLNYLLQKPYREVHSLINDFRGLSEVADIPVATEVIEE